MGEQTRETFPEERKKRRYRNRYRAGGPLRSQKSNR